ncbi:LysR family transcriptional regulator, partial [Pseudomonas sp. GW247-3R2A]
QLHSGEIKLGVPPMFGINYVPDLLSAFRREYPGIVMTVIEGSADAISQRLENREIDVALLESRRVGSAWESVLLGNDEMVLCMRED